MYFKRFNSGDPVSYKGRKFSKELHGKRGTVVCHVLGEDGAVVVDWGTDDSFVHDENRDLMPFRGKTEDEEKGDKKEPEVQKRRNRRVVTQVVGQSEED
jgi:hypothetical protein